MSITELSALIRRYAAAAARSSSSHKFGAGFAA
jgi:hypothetical protein